MKRAAAPFHGAAARIFLSPNLLCRCVGARRIRLFARLISLIGGSHAPLPIQSLATWLDDSCSRMSLYRQSRRRAGRKGEHKGSPLRKIIPNLPRSPRKRKQLPPPTRANRKKPKRRRRRQPKPPWRLKRPVRFQSPRPRPKRRRNLQHQPKRSRRAQLQPPQRRTRQPPNLLPRASGARHARLRLNQRPFRVANAAVFQRGARLPKLTRSAAANSSLPTAEFASCFLRISCVAIHSFGTTKAGRIRDSKKWLASFICAY